MTNATVALVMSILCLAFSVVFMWSTIVVLVGLIKPAKQHPKATKKLRFAVLVCARNEESVIRLPVKSALLAKYPADCREVIVLADNCTDGTAARAREAGATVWEKTEPSSGKGDVLQWGIDRLLQRGGFDAIAVFDADNVVSDVWFDAMNDALNDGETIVTGRRHSSNARANVISGWYTVYWNMMNELSNRVRTNLALSGKLTGTGFAFLPSALGPDGWRTHTMVEDTEFTVQSNLRGLRVAYVPEADYADEQPVTVTYMWRQLRRWATGGWQVAGGYFWPWLKTLVRRPSLRLFDSFFAIIIGMSVAFILLFNVAALVIRLSCGAADPGAYHFFFGIFLFLFVMGWFTAWASVALSPQKRRPLVRSIVTFPVFSLILSSSVLYTLVRPTRRWKPIPHGASPAKAATALVALCALLATGAFAAAPAAYEIGKDMETEAFWKADPVIFIRHHQNAGFKFTDQDRTQADSRRDGAVTWHGLEVYESRVTFGEKGGIDRVEVTLFNRGGTEAVEALSGKDGRTVRRIRHVEKTMTEQEFRQLVTAVRKRLTPEGKKAPPLDKFRLKDTDIRQFSQTWPKSSVSTVTTMTWNFKKGPKKADPLEPGFVRLAVEGPSAAGSSAPARGSMASGRTAAKGARNLAKNVVRDPRGDIFVDNVPMVDQGAKGYCAAAASERVLRYFGSDVDEHEIGMAAGTTVGGTRVDEMVKTVVTLGKRYRFAVQALVGDTGENRIAALEKRVEQYNKMAKKLKKPQLAESVYIRREGNVVSYNPGAAAEAMDPEILKEYLTKGAGKPKYQMFLKNVRKNAEAGLPLLWGVTLGIYPEADLPQARGGHMRLIIGINEKKEEILYSDTWGKGHELKRMPADWAWTITDTLLAVRPL